MGSEYSRGAADSAEKKIYAYNMTTKLRDPEKDYNTLNAADNDRPRGIWSNGTTMWVSDAGRSDNLRDDKIYAYDLVAKTYNLAKNISLADGRASGISAPTGGMWTDGASLWIADGGTDKIYAHKIKNNENAEDTIDCWEEV